VTNRRSRLSGADGQCVRIAGTLDALQHSDRMFTLIPESGVQVRGVVASETIDLAALAALSGRKVLVSGLASLRPSGSLLRVEAERIEPAEEHDVALWSALPRPIFGGPLDERSLRQPQGPRTGVGAILGPLPGGESDEEIIEALELIAAGDWKSWRAALPTRLAMLAWPATSSSSASPRAS